MSIAMINQTGASVPTPPSDEQTLFFDSTDDKLKKKTPSGTIVDIEGGGGGVTSFNSRTGAVLPASGDYTASQITNVPFGDIVNTNVQDAINFLDTDKIASSEKGVALGVATLDGSAKVPLSQLPASLVGAVNYQGTWNASLNSPPLSSGVGTKGYYYVVSVAGTTSLDGISDWQVGDWAIFNGSQWQQVDNTNYQTFTTSMMFVDKSGNDSTGTGSLQAPFLTVQAAMNAISGSSSSNRYIIQLNPGTYNESTLALKPWVWIQGRATNQGGPTRITCASNEITLDSSWSAGSQRGGLTNIYLTGSTGLNFDRQAISGLGSVTIELYNVGINGPVTYKASQGTLDFIDIKDCRLFGALTCSGGSLNLFSTICQSPVSFDTLGSQNFEAELEFSALASTLSVASSGSNTSNVQIKETQVSGLISQSGSGTTLSYPLAAYAPTTPANWLSQPVSVTGALDQLASQAMNQLTGEATAGPGGGSQAVTLSNAAVIGKVLTGLTESYGLVQATDSILQAIQKLVWTQNLHAQDINQDLTIPAGYNLIRGKTNLLGSAVLTIGNGAVLQII